ncbi:hypothetical protein E4U59_003402 [Claviceps monticola]|nr:hypothetical protein E4U59_003402 [Claviceps monticola]
MERGGVTEAWRQRHGDRGMATEAEKHKEQNSERQKLKSEKTKDRRKRIPTRRSSQETAAASTQCRSKPTCVVDLCWLE